MKGHSQVDTSAAQGDAPKRRLRSRDQRFKWVALYREDLESIYQIFRQVSDEVEVLTDKYELTDIKQLFGLHQDRVEEIAFISWRPYIRLDINRHMILLSIRLEDRDSLFVFDQVKSVLDRRMPPVFWRFIHSWQTTVLIPPVTILVLSFFVINPLMARAFRAFGTISDLSMFVFHTLAIVLLTWIVIRISSRIRLFRSSVIYLKHQRDVPSFSKRLVSSNLDLDVLKAIILMVVTAVVTLILVKIGLVNP